MDGREHPRDYREHVHVCEYDGEERGGCSVQDRGVGKVLIMGDGG